MFGALEHRIGEWTVIYLDLRLKNRGKEANVFSGDSNLVRIRFSGAALIGRGLDVDAYADGRRNQGDDDANLRRARALEGGREHSRLESSSWHGQVQWSRLDD